MSIESLDQIRQSLANILYIINSTAIISAGIQSTGAKKILIKWKLIRYTMLYYHPNNNKKFSESNPNKH